MCQNYDWPFDFSLVGQKLYFCPTKENRSNNQWVIKQFKHWIFNKINGSHRTKLLRSIGTHILGMSTPCQHSLANSWNESETWLRESDVAVVHKTETGACIVGWVECSLAHGAEYVWPIHYCWECPFINSIVWSSCIRCK